MAFPPEYDEYRELSLTLRQKSGGKGGRESASRMQNSTRRVSTRWGIFYSHRVPERVVDSAGNAQSVSSSGRDYGRRGADRSSEPKTSLVLAQLESRGSSVRVSAPLGVSSESVVGGDRGGRRKRSSGDEGGSSGERRRGKSDVLGERGGGSERAGSVGVAGRSKLLLRENLLHTLTVGRDSSSVSGLLLSHD